MTVCDKTTDLERAFYAAKGDDFVRCTFAGPADGESALKEARDITVKDCLFELRYPLWHVAGCAFENNRMTETCRAAFWYCEGMSLKDSVLHGTKALRECKAVAMDNCDVLSEEFGWFCKDVAVNGGKAEGNYFLFHSSDIAVKGLNFKGKYSFQYTENVCIEDAKLDTKDAFWHAKNVTVKNSLVAGEYLGWYSEGLTLIGCHIRGTQPLCYCKNLTLIDCIMEGCDLSFEHSDVTATVNGTVDSIKNPASGSVTVDGVGEIILDEYVRGDCPITVREV